MMELNVRHLSKSYGNRPVLQNVSFTLEPGQITGLLGPNGAGKSTLIKCINDLLVYEQGEISADGKKLDPSDHLRISYLPEKTYLDLNANGKETLRFFEKFYPDFDRKKACRLMEAMDLDLNQPIKSMSKGMQEKQQLILVLSRKAELYILDEPIGGVDPVARQKILDLILEHSSPEASILISTHMIGEIERILDRALILRHGKIVLDEDADTLRQKQGKSLEQIFVETLL
ncbi:ABC transporter ATP-binding protein [Allobaculum fili]|uniref:ABC transporter ATP-binding protein n=1 Tax=Allobaculum fili TaxID=2834460 RepID=UPI001E497A8C|nr:ABC transporter ATP-binding protein [Allobaculum fili]